MINDLEQFSVERLEELVEWSEVFGRHPRLTECAALARIALAAKSAKSPDEIAYELAREIVSIAQQEHIGGVCQMQAKIQCLIEESVMLAKAPGIPDGYKLVPVEPSLKMMKAAVTCEDASFDDDSDMICIHHEVIYKAMLAAAPAPEEL